MKGQELNRLLDLFLDPLLEDSDSTAEYLKAQNIDIDQFSLEMLDQIKKIQAQQKIKAGYTMAEKFKELLTQSDINGDIELPTNLAYEFRNLESELSSEEINELKDDAKKLALLKKVVEQNNRDKEK